MKTMAIRLDDELHAQLQILAQLQGTNVTDLIRTAITAHLDTSRQDPTLAAQADEVLAGIDEDASRRRDAISALFATSTKSTRRNRRTPSDGE